MTINERQDEVIEEFEEFSDWMDKYEYLIELGKEMPIFYNVFAPFSSRQKIKKSRI